MRTLFTAAGCTYIAIYAFEAVVRYLLYLGHADAAILVRDLLIFGPLAALVAWHAVRGIIHPAIVIFALLMSFHGLIIVGTSGSVGAAAYGVKVLVNLLFGVVTGSIFLSPTPRVTKLMRWIWVLSLLGVVLDKATVPFPWLSLSTKIGDFTVDVSRNWDITDPLSRRVAGFSRSSISMASFFPLLTIVLVCGTRSVWLRILMLLACLVAVFLTTQKAALLAMLPVAALLALPDGPRIDQPRAHALRLLSFVFLLLMASIPFLTSSLHLPSSSGVFSLQSFAMRIELTWPDALRWIDSRQLFLFGVGLGGISGAQRLYALDFMNPADNMFLLLWAYFGIFSILYLAVIAAMLFRPVRGSRKRMLPALAIMTFLMGYGAALSILEDQMASMFLGAAFAVLWRETRQRAKPDDSGDFLMLDLGPAGPRRAPMPTRPAGLAGSRP